MKIIEELNNLIIFIEENVLLDTTKLIKLHIITGPLASGKSTYKRKLVKKLKTTFSPEFPFGVDVADPKWWEELLFYAKKHNTSVVETHIDYNMRDSEDGADFLGKIIQPPDFIKFHIMFPKIKELFKRQKKRDKYTEIEDTKKDYEWYKKFAKQIKQKVIV